MYNVLIVKFVQILFIFINNSYVIKLSIYKRFDIRTFICPRERPINFSTKNSTDTEPLTVNSAYKDLIGAIKRVPYNRSSL